MTGREWKPGDVVMGFDGMRGFVTAKGPGCGVHMHIAASGPHVHYASGDWDLCNVDGLRPLVVIDPEDREQVERLAQAIGAINVSRLQERLREFVSPTPPKPDEPTGLGAVIECDSQNGGRCRLVRSHNTNTPWLGDGERRAWYEVPGDIVVLSPGVEAGEPS